MKQTLTLKNLFPWDVLKSRPIVTPILCIICIVCYFILDPVSFGFRAAEITVFQNYSSLYKLITSSFVHFDIVHLFTNLTGIAFLGYALERIVGSKKMLGVIVVSMVGSGLLYFGHDIYNVSIGGGASGILFGIIAAYSIVA